MSVASPWRLALCALVVGLALMNAAGAQVVVVASTPDLKSLADAVSGGTIRVESLVPPGADAEAFEAKPSHLALISKAALVLRVGLGYDDWLDRLLIQSGNPAFRAGGSANLDLSKSMALLEVQGRSVELQQGHAHGSANPHYWLDPANGEIMSAVIAEAIARVIPEKREIIAAAQARFASELRKRLEQWSHSLSPFQGAAFISYHNSWPYFARRFRLNIVDVVEPKESVTPSPTRLVALAAKMRAAKVRVLIQEPFAPVDAADYLASRSGASVVTLAPSVGALEGTGDYLSLFDTNVRRLVDALSKRP